MPIVTPGMGNCMIDSVCIALNGQFDTLYEHRTKLHEFMLNAPEDFKNRWKLQQSIYSEQDGYSLEPHEWNNEWDIVVSLASHKFKKGTKMLDSLESVHLFALANMFKRTIIVIADQTHNLNRVARFGGIFVPILFEPAVPTVPIFVSYSNSHFTALVTLNGPGRNIYPIEHIDGSGLMDMPYSSIENKKDQKIKLLKRFVDLEYASENGHTYACVKHSLRVVNFAENQRKFVAKRRLYENQTSEIRAKNTRTS